MPARTKSRQEGGQDGNAYPSTLQVNIKVRRYRSLWRKNNITLERVQLDKRKAEYSEEDLYQKNMNIIAEMIKEKRTAEHSQDTNDQGEES